jgi:hypothetical protein
MALSADLDLARSLQDDEDLLPAVFGFDATEESSVG